MLKVLDIFSGIGGFSLGLERTNGFETVAFCEIDPFCRRVLAKHWPKVPCYEDVRSLTADTLARDGIAVDVICGGFPCQDVSLAGKRAGIEGARSGLWSEYRRLIGELRPRYVIVENTPGLLSLGMGAVLGDFSSLGYDAVWDSIPASAVGAPHQRDRVWIVANANGSGRSGARQTQSKGRRRDLVTVGTGTPMANTNASDEYGRCSVVQVGRERIARQTADDGQAGGIQWSPEPDVGRVAHGVPNRVDRLGSLGNAVVPEAVTLLGNAILQAEAA